MGVSLGLAASSVLNGAGAKLFDTPEEFVQYKESSGVKDVLHVGECEDREWTICLVLFTSGKRLFCFVRLDV